MVCSWKIVKLPAPNAWSNSPRLQPKQRASIFNSPRSVTATPDFTLFSAPEIETLAALSPSLEGNTERQRNPHLFPSLAAASWVIARLGGWNCYYKPPGPITMRRGMEQFDAIHRGRQLGQSGTMLQ